MRALAPLALALWGPPALADADVTVVIEGLRSDVGVVQLALFSSPEHFPDGGRQADRFAQLPISGGRASHTFTSVPVGTWAVAFIHDEDGDEQLDTNAVGVPREGFGASNDATRLAGPPRFSDAAFAVEDAPVKQVLHPRYFLPLGD